MTQQQKQRILEAWAWCDEEDKSTEFMLQYMSDVTGLDYEDVVDYVVSHRSTDDRKKYYEALNKEQQ